jgi:ferredoxin
MPKSCDLHLKPGDPIGLKEEDMRQNEIETGICWRLIPCNCTGCGICADVCPYDAIAMGRNMAYPEPVPGKCVACLICVQQCPFDAIEVLQAAAAPG